MGKRILIRTAWALLGLVAGLIVGIVAGLITAGVRLPSEDQFAPGDGAGALLFCLIGAVAGSLAGLLLGIVWPALRSRRSNRSAKNAVGLDNVWPPPPSR